MYRISLVIVASALLSACVSSRTPLRTIQQAETRWASGGLSDYSFGLIQNAQVPDTECGIADRPIDIEVRGGRTVRFGTCDVSSAYAQAFGSIPAIFATLRAERMRRPVLLEVKFNADLGYPEVISINHARWTTDGNENFFVRDFRRLNQ